MDYLGRYLRTYLGYEIFKGYLGNYKRST
jgi:hypothetical protein